MAKKLGKNYRLFVSAAGGTTFAAPNGQGDLTINRGGDDIDTTTKESGSYGTSAPGQKSLSLTQAIIPDLPDVQYTRLKELDGAGESAVYQVREAPFAEDDVVFECEMFTRQTNTDLNRTSAAGTSFTLTAATAPTVDEI
jgi:hypothetical protein